MKRNRYFKGTWRQCLPQYRRRKLFRTADCINMVISASRYPSAPDQAVYIYRQHQQRLIPLRDGGQSDTSAGSEGLHLLFRNGFSLQILTTTSTQS